MKTFYAVADYERLTDTGTICEDEAWNPLSLTLFAEDGSTVLGEKTFGGWPDEDVPKEWASVKDVMLIRQEGSCDYQIILDDDEADPSIDELTATPVMFRGEHLEFMESHGLSSPMICELHPSGEVATTG